MLSAANAHDLRGHVVGIGHLAESRAVTAVIRAVDTGGGVLSTDGIYVQLTVGPYSRTIERQDIYTLNGRWLGHPNVSTVTVAELVPTGSGWTTSVVAP